MSEIFISYAREDRFLAENLSNELRALGYDVWWDAELVGSDDFYEVILESLQRAKAAIVIWTESSAKSRFVRDEARFALHLNKLIPVRVEGFDPIRIPFGFQSLHTDKLCDRDKTIKALTKLGVSRTRKEEKSCAPENVICQKIQGSRDIQELVSAMRIVLGDRVCQALEHRLMFLISDLQSYPKAYRPDRGSVRFRSFSEAFYCGLRLQTPDFLLSRQGVFYSLGITVAYVALLTAGIVLLIYALTKIDDNAIPWIEGFTGWTAAGGFLLLSLLSWNRYTTLLKQKLFVAAAVVAIPWVFTFTMGFGWLIGMAMVVFVGVPEFVLQFIWMPSLVVALFLAARKISLAR